jgi:gliding motility-associated-like protein
VETIVCELLVPNVISPNGDDSNEVFEVPGMDRFPGSTCRIYNRWGGEVFRSDAFGTSPGWAPGADDAAEGTYFYEIIVARTDGVLFISDADGFREITQPGPVPLVGTLTVVR